VLRLSSGDGIVPDWRGIERELGGLLPYGINMDWLLCWDAGLRSLVVCSGFNASDVSCKLACRMIG